MDVAGILESCHTFREHETWNNILDEVGSFACGVWNSGMPVPSPGLVRALHHEGERPRVDENSGYEAGS